MEQGAAFAIDVGMKTQFHPLFEMPDLEPWPEPVDGQKLLDDAAGILRRVAVLPQWAPEALALWTPHTYAFQLREISTYLGVESPEKRCGKTTLLAVLGKLVSRPVMAANISSPAFFRVIEEMQPTLLIDEADAFLKKRSELRGILNAGYTRDTAYVMRVSNQKSDPHGEKSEGGSRLVRFSCWCPKVMASIGRLPETLADRCIAIRMQRKTSQEQCERLRDLDAAMITMVRRRCARFVADHAQEIAKARPVMPTNLNDREADFWEPLVVIADVAGGRWPELARQAAVGLTANARENNPMGSLLLDIWLIFLREKADRIFSRTLAARLNELGDRPWLELKKAKEIDALWLAKRFQPYGVRPRTIWIGDTHAKGYLQNDFEVLFRRYIPRSEVEALLAEFGGQAAEHGNQRPAVSDQKAEAAAQKPEGGDQPSEAGRTPEDDAAAA